MTDPSLRPELPAEEVTHRAPGRGADRRGVIVGLAVTAAAGAAGYVVASRDRGDGAAPSAGPDDAPAGRGTGQRLAAVADLPPGGGVVVKEAGVVVTRDGDQIRAFSATCTHQGCVVASVTDGTINCNCHNSRFDAATGAPVDGPAPRPLPPVRVEVRDGAVFRT